LGYWDIWILGYLDIRYWDIGILDIWIFGYLDIGIFREFRCLEPDDLNPKLPKLSKPLS
jgi:hypothetical protein